MRLLVFFWLSVVAVSCTPDDSLTTIENIEFELKFKSDPTDKTSKTFTIPVKTSTSDLRMLVSDQNLLTSEVATHQETGEEVTFYSVRSTVPTDMGLQKKIIVTHGYAFTGTCYEYGTLIEDTESDVAIFVGRGPGESTGLDPICPDGGGGFA